MDRIILPSKHVRQDGLMSTLKFKKGGFSASLSFRNYEFISVAWSFHEFFLTS